MNREKDLILDELRRTNGNLSKVARTLGIDYFALRTKYGQQVRQVPFRPALGREPVDIRVLGKPGLEQYVIAVKRAGSVWPTKYAAIIEDARRKYDAGTHEMYQGVNKGWVVLYLEPRMVPDSPRNYFSSMGSNFDE